jgi:hypothetical protein
MIDNLKVLAAVIDSKSLTGGFDVPIKCAARSLIGTSNPKTAPLDSEVRLRACRNVMRISESVR